MFAITGSCGRCGNLVDFRVVHVGGSGRLDPKLATHSPGAQAGYRVVEISGDGAEATFRGHGVGICPRCDEPTLFDFTTKRQYFDRIRKNLTETEGLMGGQGLISVNGSHPSLREPETDEAWPAELVRQFADAQRMLDQDMTPSIITATCRTVLDIATRKLDPDLAGKPLQKRIDGLLANGTITKPIADWGHAIRLDGNEAVHEGVGERSEARQYIAFLKIFLHIAFTLPAGIARKSVQP